MKWSPETLAAAAGGRLVQRGSRDIEGVFIDSRSPRAGALFVPIVAARDGHDFISAAVDGGATAILAEIDPPRLAPHVTIVKVLNTLDALHRMTREARTHVRGPVIVISGSNGKTTTRSMVASVVRCLYPNLICTQGNLNNHLGVPLTVLNGPEQPDAMVLELGMSAPGENDQLAAMVQPTIAVITSVALEHLEFMGTIEAIAAAEAEPLMHITPDGIAVIPGDEPLLRPHVDKLAHLQVRTFGSQSEATVRILAVAQKRGISATFAVAGHAPFDLHLPLFGLHNARNAAAALTVGSALDIPVPAMVEALQSVEPVGDRGRVIEAGPHLVIADCYNANPGSVSAALASLGALQGNLKRMAILGDMLELGPTDLQLHAEVGRQCAVAGIDALVGFGPRSQATVDAARQANLVAHATQDVEDAVRWIAEAADRPSVIVVKGSRGMALERCVAGLLATFGSSTLSDRA